MPASSSQGSQLRKRIPSLVGEEYPAEDLAVAVAVISVSSVTWIVSARILTTFRSVCLLAVVSVAVVISG